MIPDATVETYSSQYCIKFTQQSTSNDLFGLGFAARPVRLAISLYAWSRSSEQTIEISGECNTYHAEADSVKDMSRGGSSKGTWVYTCIHPIIFAKTSKFGGL
jgi:uncharacterized circularly permuted ATP-grasp superfamily protein